jgi:hypothetical protein
MFAKHFGRSALLPALVILLVLLTPALSLAQGSGPNDALAPAGGSVHLAPGQQQWYVFTTSGADRDDPSKVAVTLRASPQGSAAFNIWTADQLREMQNQDPNEPVEPIGRGTKVTEKQGDETVDLFGGALIWAQDWGPGQTYYVQVLSTGPESDYGLSITGGRISFPAPPAPAQPSTLPVTGVEPSQAAVPEQRPSGSSLETALTSFGQSRTLSPGQQQWYTFKIAGASENEATPRIKLQLTGQPAGGAKFSVWTNERLQADAQRAFDDKLGPVGMGTKVTVRESDNTRVDQYGGDLFWYGDARTGDTFYVVVEPTGTAPVQYSLTFDQLP